jgi:hypothetical protein
MKHAVVMISMALMLVGCESVETQHRDFIAYQNREIGNQFYSYEKTGMREVKINDTESEFVPDPLPISGGGVAWTVDTRTRGLYFHPNGMTFQIEGVKKSWRFVGDPQRCLLKTAWWSGNW